MANFEAIETRWQFLSFNHLWYTPNKPLVAFPRGIFVTIVTYCNMIRTFDKNQIYLNLERCIMMYHAALAGCINPLPRRNLRGYIIGCSFEDHRRKRRSKCKGNTWSTAVVLIMRDVESPLIFIGKDLPNWSNEAFIGPWVPYLDGPWREKPVIVTG